MIGRMLIAATFVLTGSAAFAQDQSGEAAQCRKLGEDFLTTTTRNHHCSDDCRNEPTRTNYVIEMPLVSAPYRYANPRLTCNSGPCAFSQTIAASVTWGGAKARASFDAWSFPMTWTLTVDVMQCKT